MAAPDEAEAAFQRAGILVEVSTYTPSRSIIELLFDVGWERTAELVRQSPQSVSV